MSLLINGFFAQFLRYSQKNPNGHVWREGVAEREEVPSWQKGRKVPFWALGGFFDGDG